MLDEVSRFTGHTYAESTKKTYKSHLYAYLRFCLKFGLCPVPVDQFTLLAYTAFLARSLKPSSINGYLNIVRILHLESGLPNPLADNFQLKNLKKGIAGVKGSPPSQKLPITSKILLNIRNCLCFTTASDIVFWAACLVAYFGLLRKSTLLPVSQKTPGDSCILRKDLSVDSTHVFSIHVRKTKTIQLSERILVLPYVSCPGSPLCPYSAMMDLLVVAPRAPGLPLFS